jgi:olfactory receptor
VLVIFWFNMKPISFVGCFLQMFIMNTFLPMESSTFLVMAYDRYVAVCHPLHYPSIITEQFVINAAIFIVFRNLLATLPTPVLAARLNYCASNMIESCICANISVAKLSCGDIHLNKLYQFVSVWCLLGSDLVLILLSYCFILRAVIHQQSGGTVTKALSTCGSHVILILFFYTILLVFIFTNKAGKKIPSEVPILLNVLHHLIPPALNPIVYGVRTQEIKQGIIKLIKHPG